MFGLKKQKADKALDTVMGDRVSNSAKAFNTENLYQNNYIDICSEACACCWAKKVPADNEGKLRYLGDRVGIGHSSVVEHSNVVKYFEIPMSSINDVLEFSSYCKYLNIRIQPGVKFPNKLYILTGGSIRAYKNVIENIPSLENTVIKELMANFYKTSWAPIFNDYIEWGIMDKSAFRCGFDAVELARENSKTIDLEKVEIINVDPLEQIIHAIKTSCPEPELFLSDIVDLMDFATITVLFKDMSRTGTHQLVRHRNGITQESQRYVDYSAAEFANPASFKPDKYNPDEKYKISFGRHNLELTLKELGDMMMEIYPQLLNPTNQANTKLAKEDARGFLPSNVKCKKIYITFTYKTFFKFLQLRSDKAAQPEIRSFSDVLLDWSNKSEDMGIIEYTDSANIPRFLREPSNPYASIDEEEIFEDFDVDDDDDDDNSYSGDY